MQGERNPYTLLLANKYSLCRNKSAWESHPTKKLRENYSVTQFLLLEIHIVEVKSTYT